MGDEREIDLLQSLGQVLIPHVTGKTDVGIAPLQPVNNILLGVSRPDEFKTDIRISLETPTHKIKVHTILDFSHVANSNWTAFVGMSSRSEEVRIHAIGNPVHRLGVCVREIVRKGFGDGRDNVRTLTNELVALHHLLMVRLHLRVVKPVVYGIKRQ